MNGKYDQYTHWNNPSAAYKVNTPKSIASLCSNNSIYKCKWKKYSIHRSDKNYKAVTIQAEHIYEEQCKHCQKT